MHDPHFCQLSCSSYWTSQVCHHRARYKQTTRCIQSHTENIKQFWKQSQEASFCIVFAAAMAVGLMEVFLVMAKGLENKDFVGKMDPYVLIQYKGQERRSSVARGKGSNPTWNERFTFKVEYPGSGSEYKIILRIMDKDTFSADDFVGKATIYVEELLAQGSENGTAELHPSKYSVVNAENSYYGEIEVGVTFTLKEEEECNEEEYGGWKESSY